jgi:cytochrome c biogenesis protein CcmG, thiol:disulfide interchange protein DsbE
VRRVLAVLVLFAVGATACGGGSAGGASDNKIAAGSPSKLASTLRSMRGRPVVVNYWATWCEPCKVEMPRLVDAYKEHSDRVGFLGVNVEDDVEAAQEFVRRYAIPFRSVADPNGKIRRDEKVLGLPVTQFYASDGELAYVHQGEIKADELEEKIEDVLRLD